VEPLDLQVHLFTILGKQRCELIHYDLRGQSVVSISAYWAMSIEHGVVHSRGGIIPSFFIQVPRATTLVLWHSMSFSGWLVSFMRKPCGLSYFSFDDTDNFLRGLFNGGFTPLHHEDFTFSIRVRL
jgi:hypothetical protein